MASKDERPGLLSKVAMFVRNPTKDWSELGQPEQSTEGGYDKQALKAMIERKRQNDFVRRREFDQLRKLRSRDPGAQANNARPSFFQTSITTDPDGRAVTLKKIDEIEAQMSKQWWKGKQETASAPTVPDSLSASAAVTTHGATIGQSPLAGVSLPTTTFEATAVLGLGSTAPPDTAGEFMATQMAEPAGAVAAATASVSALQGPGGGDVAFSSSLLFAIAADEMATDPELEEAAIRHANGDDEGAANGLIQALRGAGPNPDAAMSWAAALLDLYRASGDRAGFDRAANEFSLQLGIAQADWLDLSDRSAPQSVQGAHARTWECPEALDAQAMESLRDALANSPMPWDIGWSALKQIEPSAIPLLDGLFASLCEENVSLRISGGERLAEVLRGMTPSGDGRVDPLWWTVRLNVLRTLRLEDDFELAALDYCISHAVAPLAWQEARCQLLPAVAQDGAAAGDDLPALSGEILGDASEALAPLEAIAVGKQHLHISCRHLLRVDFAAAGSILNWVATRQAEGQMIQFHQVHRLVAAFFNVIGINEHAKVIPRGI